MSAARPAYGPTRADAPRRLSVRLVTHPDQVWLDGIEHRIVERVERVLPLPETDEERDLRKRRGTAAPTVTFTESRAVPVHKLPREAVDNSNRAVESNQPAADAAQPES